MLDAVSMDVKAPLRPEAYTRCAGRSVPLQRILRSLQILEEAQLEVEFRTTVVPGLLEESDIYQIARILPSGQARILSPGGMVAPGGVAVLQQPDGREAVFVADFWTLREFDGRKGLQEGSATAHLVGPGLAPPLTASADGDRLVISSWVGSVVQVRPPSKERRLYRL